MSTETDHANDNPDDELAAMRAIVEAFIPLADFEQSRVLRWAADRYGVSLPEAPAGDSHA
jgi:hypothetical protein